MVAPVPEILTPKLVDGTVPLTVSTAVAPDKVSVFGVVPVNDSELMLVLAESVGPCVPVAVITTSSAEPGIGPVPLFQFAAKAQTVDVPPDQAIVAIRPR